MKKSTTITATIAAIAALILAGCGDYGVGTQTDDPRVAKFLNRFVEQIENHPLILEPGEAWVGAPDNTGAMDGLIFHDNGTYRYIVNLGGSGWAIDSYWAAIETNNKTWSDNGVYYLGYLYTYTVNGNILTLENQVAGTMIFFRSSNINATIQ